MRPLRGNARSARARMTAALTSPASRAFWSDDVAIKSATRLNRPDIYPIHVDIGDVEGLRGVPQTVEPDPGLVWRRCCNLRRGRGGRTTPPLPQLPAGVLRNPDFFCVREVGFTLVSTQHTQSLVAVMEVVWKPGLTKASASRVRIIIRPGVRPASPHSHIADCCARGRSPGSRS